jgi:hypothetical protein
MVMDDASTSDSEIEGYAKHQATANKYMKTVSSCFSFFSSFDKIS